MEKNVLRNVDTSELKVRAKEHFINICGFYRNPERFKPMLEKGMKIHEEIKNSLKVKIIVSEYGKDILKENRIEVEGKAFFSPALEQIEKDKVRKIYAYMLTAGHVELEGIEDALLGDFFRDTWGTAYVDGGRDLFREQLQGENPGCILSETFGPGFYGMEVSQMKDFFNIINGSAIGVSLTSGGMMKPQKSCAGFFLVMEEGSMLPEDPCQNCTMEVKSCRFCGKKPRI